MSNFIITVIGAGVIGTSLGLALKREKDPPRLLTHDKDLEKANTAVKRGAFDKAEWNLVNACEPADLIILAIPLGGIQSTLAAIAPYVKEGAIISDTARSKVPVLKWATEVLPAHAHFIGGDPLVYSSGSTFASANLFRHRPYCLTPSPTANEAAVQLLVGLVDLLGAKPLFIDAEEHDGLTVAVDTLPIVAGVSLVNTVACSSSWREMRRLAGSLFEQASSGASGDPDSLKDILLANRETLIHWLDNYTGELNQLRTLLADPNIPAETLIQKLDQAIVERHNWQVDYQQSRFDDPELVPLTVEKSSLMRQLIGFGGVKRGKGARK